MKVTLKGADSLSADLKYARGVLETLGLSDAAYEVTDAVAESVAYSFAARGMINATVGGKIPWGQYRANHKGSDWQARDGELVKVAAPEPKEIGQTYTLIDTSRMIGSIIDPASKDRVVEYFPHAIRITSTVPYAEYVQESYGQWLAVGQDMSDRIDAALDQYLRDVLPGLWR